MTALRHHRNAVDNRIAFAAPNAAERAGTSRCIRRFDTEVPLTRRTAKAPLPDPLLNTHAMSFNGLHELPDGWDRNQRSCGDRRSLITQCPTSLMDRTVAFKISSGARNNTLRMSGIVPPCRY